LSGTLGAVEVSNFLNPLKQLGEEIGDEEGIGKNQRPTGYSLETNLYLSPLFCFSDT